MLPCMIGQITVACEGMKDNGGCKIYSREGVGARNYRMGTCAFLELRKPIVVKGAKARVGQQKQAKHKAKVS